MGRDNQEKEATRGGDRGVSSEGKMEGVEKSKELGSPGGLHEVGAVWSPVGPVLGAQLQGFVAELRAERVLEAAQHHYHPLQDLPKFLGARSGGLGLGAFSRLPWGRDGAGSWVTGGSEH